MPENDPQVELEFPKDCSLPVLVPIVSKVTIAACRTMGPPTGRSSSVKEFTPVFETYHMSSAK
jgi:hypothetical protein